MGFSKRKKRVDLIKKLWTRSPSGRVMLSNQFFLDYEDSQGLVPLSWSMNRGENILRLALLVGSSLDSPMAQKIPPAFTYSRPRRIN